MPTADKIVYGFIEGEPSDTPTFIKTVWIRDGAPSVYFLLLMSGMTPGVDLGLDLSIKAFDEAGEEIPLAGEPLLDGFGTARLRLAYPISDLFAGKVVARLTVGGQFIGESRLTVADES